MRNLFLISLLFVMARGNAAVDSSLVKRSLAFHQELISKGVSLKDFLDEQLSYGHSNGWLETKEEMLQHLGSGMMSYHAIKEDSIKTNSDNELGYVRFVANMDVALNGNAMSFRLKVLEVWRRKNGIWVLYARQAIRA